MVFSFAFAVAKWLGFITPVTLAGVPTSARHTSVRRDHLTRTTARDDARARDDHVYVFATADADARRERAPREHERTR
jgi:hypothetical protein